MNKTKTLISAIQTKRFGEAQSVFSGIMQEKVEAALAKARKRLNEDDNTKACVHCGSTKDLDIVDGHAICAECDPER